MKRFGAPPPAKTSDRNSYGGLQNEINEEPKTKRNRSSNFSKEDETILIRCVMKHKNVIESKKTDAYSIADKKAAWIAVEQEYNATFANERRTLKALRDKYTNIKSVIRKEHAAERLETKATGGGPPKTEWKPKSEEINELVAVIAKSIHGDPEDCFDDECVEEFLIGENEENEENIYRSNTPSKDNQKEKETHFDEYGDLDWSQRTPSMLKKTPKKVLRVQNHTPEASNQILEFKKKILEQEIELNNLKKLQLTQAIDESKGRLELSDLRKLQVHQMMENETKLHELRVEALQAKIMKHPNSPFSMNDDDY